MNTPIFDFLTNYRNQNGSRLHMPGHKGIGIAPKGSSYESIYSYDITEITNADELFSADGIILESEENTSYLYQTKHTSFSAGGSTLCIQAMLKLVAKPGETIIAARNVHSSFINTCALLDITPYFVLPKFNDDFFVSGEITPQSIQQAINDCPNAKAVYITSPDYLGCISDVKAIAAICNQHHIPLVVDNAHGAHLKFLPEDIHPITLGATLCCDSAHKTLPVLTGGAYLHVSNKSNITKQQVKSGMALFGSTSPSYLILASLDLNNCYLDCFAKKDFEKLQENVLRIEQIAREKGFTPISKYYDITKLTFDAYQVGLTGVELKRHFQNYQIEPEYTAERHVVLMLSPMNSDVDLQRIITAIQSIKQKPRIQTEKASYCIPKRHMNIREALFSEQEKCDINEAIGKIAAEVKIKCPPGVPIVLPGEQIDQNTQKLLKKSSISSLNVVK
ncbi:aminotransferase class I/II-fold pyridoxal phosphate-dependent enzyme [Paludicola sp. MB14-C6]|uniref:aminotransferase class I/II-fold pyridoxal phosphate-dependent enzyme n=1 Tax=Paludihabitans sp. MB14-C6 TaxID=3070656 RepID=UPI0027DC3D90|nr:aminotransferase class I/II-fold pyridoxal phosphate-dependent enzyme [Paludicola sp. MB14-C6]WMJ22549.1 aminotransferase class I/II-fold pyridoxal phosphate-dependent enzyme [Paludicola sp. MB14-C6]